MGARAIGWSSAKRSVKRVLITGPVFEFEQDEPRVVVLKQGGNHGDLKDRRNEGHEPSMGRLSPCSRAQSMAS